MQPVQRNPAQHSQPGGCGLWAAAGRRPSGMWWRLTLAKCCRLRGVLGPAVRKRAGGTPGRGRVQRERHAPAICAGWVVRMVAARGDGGRMRWPAASAGAVLSRYPLAVAPRERRGQRATSAPPPRPAPPPCPLLLFCTRWWCVCVGVLAIHEQ